MTFKEKAIHEVKLLIAYTFFLTFFFSIFTLYRLLTDPNASAAMFRFGYNFFEAVVLSKIILLGQHFHLGDKYNDRPLIIPTLYKTLLFTIFVLIMSIAEEFFVGILKGKTVEATLNHLLEFGYRPLFGKMVLMSFMFVFFFGILETARLIGGQKLYDLFFKKR